MSYKIIVARYNEDIGWLNSEMNNCIIYNKGYPLNIKNEIFLKNVGRESETYLNYIITNYNNLPDVIVFTQARIYDHIGKDDVNYLLTIKDQALKNCISTNTIKEEFNNPSFTPDWNYSNNEYFLKNNYKDKPIKFIDWFKTNINENYQDPIVHYPNGIFALKKEKILNKPLSYYEKFLLEVNHHINPAEGHFLERSWYYMFNE